MSLIMIIICTIVLFSSANLYTESRMIIISLIVPATVVPLVVLMGITLVLGIVLVYYIISKKSRRVKKTTNHRLP